MIKMSKALRARIEAAKKTDQYWIDSAKLDFALALESRRKKINMNYAAVADAISTSPAYISKVFRGDANLTIESMVKLARSLGCNVDFQLQDINEGIQARPFHIQTEHTIPKRHLFANFIAGKDGAWAGTFIPEEGTQSINDQIYQNAA